MSDFNAEEHDLLTELARMNGVIESYATQLDTINESLQVIEEENRNEGLSRQVVESQTAYERNPATIPAEEALDTITRLENTLKIVKRRNQLLAKENTTQQKLLEDRSKFLLKETKKHDYIADKTGWHEHYYADFESMAQKEEEIREMSEIEAIVQMELRAARVEIKKKENQIRALEAQVEKGSEIESLLNNAFNDIRVKERDIRQVEIQLERMRKYDEKNEEALTVYSSQRQDASLVNMETHRDFLKDAVANAKAECRQQDVVIKAQLTRQQQLHARLDTIMKSIREMKFDKEYERNVSKSALVPSASREEPRDISLILPKNETIPIDTYRLLHKNNEYMRNNLGRKDVIVLEKEAVIQALESTLTKYANTLNMSSKQQEDLKLSKDVEMSDLMEELHQQHQNYLHQLEQLMYENNQLKKKLYRVEPRRTAVKNH